MIDFLNDITANFAELRQARMENVSSLPTGLGTFHRGYTVYYQGQLYVWDGSQWQTWGAAGAVPLPQRTYFVSPGFTGRSSPYYDSLRSLFGALGNFQGTPTLADTVTVIVYPGIEDQDISINYPCNLYFLGDYKVVGDITVSGICNMYGRLWVDGFVLYSTGGYATEIEVSYIKTIRFGPHRTVKLRNCHFETVECVANDTYLYNCHAMYVSVIDAGNIEIINCRDIDSVYLVCNKVKVVDTSLRAIFGNVFEEAVLYGCNIEGGTRSHISFSECHKLVVRDCTIINTYSGSGSGSGMFVGRLWRGKISTSNIYGTEIGVYIYTIEEHNNEPGYIIFDNAAISGEAESIRINNIIGTGSGYYVRGEVHANTTPYIGGPRLNTTNIDIIVDNAAIVDIF
jgi:hypothetical protein